jgi:hypothetical protein
MQRAQSQGEVILLAIQERLWRLIGRKRYIVPLDNVSCYMSDFHQPELFPNAGVTAFATKVNTSAVFL